MVPQDRRIRRTQHLLARALIDLTLEKGYDTVTIRDITERADIGYATFFRHYRDKDGLLDDVVDVVLEELTGMLAPSGPAGDPAEVGALIFQYVQTNSQVVRVLLASQAVQERVVPLVTGRMLQEQKPRPGSPVPFEIAVHHLVTATISLMAWWLGTQMAYPPDRMGQIYAELIVLPTRALAFAL